ncbi:MAG: glycoside hydrolase family 15 protein [Thermomicrobiales bacterium]
MSAKQAQSETTTWLTDPASVLHDVAAADVSADDCRYRPIADYAMVGNAQSAALIASNGSVDWLCLPHFDSPAVLCRILDADVGGFLTVIPDGEIASTRRRYREQSAVLETEFDLGDRTLMLTDAMPLADAAPGTLLDGIWNGASRHRLVRLVTARGGDVGVTLKTRIGFNYCATSPGVDIMPGRGAILTGPTEWMALVWPGELTDDDGGALQGHLTVCDGDTIALVLGHAYSADAARALLDRGDWREEIAATDEAWRSWASQLAIAADGPYATTMRRSALTLRMLTFEPTGALVAAPTTSLPEAIGGIRNWDYRYCWLRDATFTLYALLLVGDRTAALAFWRWIEGACVDKGAAGLQIMYGIHGERDLPERTLPHLSGYRDSRPVRIGNAAYDQRQLDIYGEVLDAFWFYDQHGGVDGEPPQIDPGVRSLMRDIADQICEVWRQPDQGIWEVRGKARHYVYSKAMCWVGLDRAVRLADKIGDGGDVERWACERDAIFAEILERGYDRERNAFIMAYDSKDVDAAVLRLPLVGFLPADDPRIVGTIELIQRELQHDGLVHRYRADDNLPGGEGAFSICTYWLVDCLTAIGRIDEAKAIFDRMLGYASDLGLFAEEVDPATEASLGNYPQAFTHLALIDAGVDLTEALSRRTAMPGEHAERARAVRRGRTRRGEPGGMGDEGGKDGKGCKDGSGQ